MFESCLRNYSSLLWAAFFVEPEHRPCSRSQFFDLKVQSGKAERESCLRNKRSSSLSAWTSFVITYELLFL